MSVAVLLSGEARSFAKTEIPEDSDRFQQQWARSCYENQRWYLYRKLDDPEFFISLADDEYAYEVEPLFLQHYPKEKVHVEIVEQPELHPPPNDPECRYHAAWFGKAPAQSILRDFWHRKRVWRFMREKAKETQRVGTAYLRLRPDLFFHRFNSRPVGAWDCFTPYWAGWFGVNDRFAVMGHMAASAYFNALDDIDPLLKEGCPFHPEALLLAALERRGIKPSATLNTTFSTLRRDGQLVVPTMQELTAGFIEAQMHAFNGS